MERSRVNSTDGLRVFIVAGEASGDLHASNLIRQMARLRPDVSFEGFGGQRMDAAGCRLHSNITHLSSMGISFLSNVFSFVRLVRYFNRLVRERPPSTLVLVDFPGFNFILARIAKARGIPVVYYICPQIWAWAPWRRRKILRLTDLLMVILPFEETFYRAPGKKVIYVGHPLADALAEETPPEEMAQELADRLHIAEDTAVIGLFPGSRTQEIRELLPLFRKILEKLELDPARYRILLSCCREEFRPQVETSFRGFCPPIEILEGNPHPIMAACDVALVASGTATLELAFYQKPMVVLYKVGRLAHLGFRILSTSPYISLVNILGGGDVVPEDIAARDNSQRHAEWVRAFLEDTREKEECLRKLGQLKGEVFLPGASLRAAEALAEFLEESRNPAVKA